MIKKSAVRILLTATIMITGCSSATVATSSQTNSLKNVTIQTDYSIDANDIPYFEAQALGYYKSRGLAVTIRSSTGGSVTLEALASGRDTFGQSDGPTLVSAVAAGEPLIMVANWLNRSQVAIASFCATHITTPKDLEGKTIALTADDSGFDAQFGILLQRNGVSPSSVHTVDVTGSALASALAAHRVDGILTTVNGSGLEFSETAQQQHLGSTCSLLASDWGVQTLGYGISVTRSTLKNNPQLVRNFIAATIQGWDAALKNPQPGLALMKADFPSGSMAYWEAGWKISKQFIHSSSSVGKSIGYMSPSDMSATVKVVAEYTHLPSTAVSNYFTDAYLP